MFEQATLTAVPAANRLWTTCAGVTGQALIVGSMLLAPLISPSVLPQLQSYVTLTAPGPPPAPPAPGPTVRPKPVQGARVFRCTFCAPVSIPATVAMIHDEPPAVAETGVPGGVIGGQKDGIQGGVLDSIMRAGAYTPPLPRPVESPAPAKPAPPAVIPRVRVGGLVKLASPIRRIDPVYPALARQARIEGVVELEGVVGIDGRIHELKVKSGHPFLVKAAVDAVKQWIYTPGTLNGDLVEVIAPITVTFRLDGH